MGNRCADHVTSLYPQKLALTSPTGGGRSVGIVHSRTKVTEFQYQYWCGPGSSVSIATDYGLDGPGIESQWEATFSAVQTGPGAHPASCTMGTGSFTGVESDRGVTLTPQRLIVPRSKNRVELYLDFP